MAKGLSTFTRLAEFPRLYTAHNEKLRCTAIALPGGGVCVFNPVAGLKTEVQSSLEAIGEVTHILAPNHYHNKALAEYAAQLPGARLVASEAALPRLEKITQLKIDGLDPVLSLLPRQLTILSPPGLKTGEVWIRARAKGNTVWCVGDAFCTRASNTKETVADMPELLATFPRYGVAEKSVYLEWADRQIDNDQPTMIVTCHGRIVRAKDLATKLHRLLQRFP